MKAAAASGTCSAIAYPWSADCPTALSEAQDYAYSAPHEMPRLSRGRRVADVQPTPREVASPVRLLATHP